MSTLPKAVAMARFHCWFSASGPSASNAAFALNDALDLSEKRQFVAAKARALKSLRYSIGVFHPDYAIAERSSVGC